MLRFFLLSCFFVGILFQGLFRAAVLNVPSQYSSIQAAINSAQNGDTVLAAEGTYFENINFSGKNIVIASIYILDQDPMHIVNTVINGSRPFSPDSASCVRIVSGEDSTAILCGFTITGGTGTKWIDEHGAGVYREGGGIIITLSSPTIRDNLIINNEAIDRTGVTSAGGGGIRAGDSNAHLYNNIIANNKGHYGAGVVWNYATGEMKNNIIINNSGGEDFGGGGVWTLALGATIIENNVIAFNSVTGSGGNKGKGGGILVWSTLIKAKNNIIWGNMQTSGDQICLTGSSSADVTYSDVEGGFTGEGNLNEDPVLSEDIYLPGANTGCIDGGDPNPVFNDPEDPANPGFALYPSQGTTRNDMGAYGGSMSKLLPQIVTEIKEKRTGNNVPKDFYLYQNYPNPFNPETTIKFSVPSKSYVSLKIYNILGKQVAELINNEKQEGIYSVNFNSSDYGLSTGVYFCELESGNFLSTRKLLLLK
ncbi:MAG TPA: T9SS type A sorting domain-containing protein [Ignavibacteriaceae bacterium]|nr:T9SS type A sorting domain-containing protein [Ignavibacteriaceae bacterium]